MAAPAAGGWWAKSSRAQRPALAADGSVNRAAYACCVLDRLRAGLRRRDVYVPKSIRWGDPRAELLPPETWDEQRDQTCEALALDP